ncbi:metacaspase-6-like [Miscanthus floridulus]|uniref:metacaspase-6-like n=1 Tax=Miscanthus floridulus TaxID=154761 RepID=UPI00345A6431
MGQKRAVLVGINYPGTDGELKGCLNDVARMRRCLVDRFGFDEAGIRVLADADPSTPPPTGANIRLELERLVAGARPGDALFFHYSGHGLQLPAETGEDDDTGYDECIVPCDLNLIKDQDFTELVAKVPDGCRFTMVSDSCHSGGLIDKTKEQIGNSTKQNRTQQRREREMKPPPGSGTGLCASLVRIVRGVLESLEAGIHCNRRGQQQGSSSSVQSGGVQGQEPDDTKAAKGGSVSIRSLPLSTFIEMLKDKTGRHDVGVGSIRTTLFHHFGDEASPKVKRFMKVMVAKLRHDDREAEQSRAPRGAEALAQEQDTHSVEEVYAGPAAAPPRNGVLISGCQTDETSADATTADGMSYGALSNAIQTILAGNGSGKKRGAAAVTNRELVVRVREMLSKQGYTQQPGLYCSDEHARLPFIC